MKFKNLLLASTALFALAACNSDNDNLPAPDKSRASDLAVRIEIPSPTTRSVENEVIGEGLTPKAAKAHVYVMDKYKNTVIKDAPAIREPGTSELVFNATIKDMLLDGSEVVRVIAYNDPATAQSKLDYLIKDLKPNKTGVTKAIYASDKNLDAGAEINGVVKYKVNMEVTSLIARLELSGKALYDQNLVKSFILKAETPVLFTGQFNDATIIEPTPTNPLWYNLVAGDYDAIQKDKVLANHVFRGNELAFGLGFVGELYKSPRNADGSFVTVIAENNETNYIYSKDNKWYVYKGRITNLTDDEVADFFEIEATQDVNGDWDLGVISDQATPLRKSQLDVVPLDDQNRTLFFTMYGNKKYEGGNIYAINLSDGITWNDGQDGKNPNEYSPEVNPGNPDQPEVNKKEAEITVKATVKKWVRNENTHVNVYSR